MKQLLSYLIILVLYTTVNAQAIEDNPVISGTNSTKKLLVEKCEEYAIINDVSVIENKVIHRRYMYDGKGNLISDVIYNMDNQSDSTYFIYTYNGLAIETKKYNRHINMESDEIEAATEYYDYDTQMKLLKKTIVTESGGTTIYTYTYNENGLINTILADSAERKRYTYFYNDSGKVIRVLGETPMINNPGWLLIDSFTYEYDAKNNLVKELHIKEGTERKRSQFEYYENGKLSKKTIYVYGDTKPVYTTEYMYDAKTGFPAGRSVKTLPDKNKLEYKTIKYIYTYTYRK